MRYDYMCVTGWQGGSGMAVAQWQRGWVAACGSGSVWQWLGGSLVVAAVFKWRKTEQN
jgi:hypothetical protein